MERSVDQCVQRTDALHEQIARHLENVVLDVSTRGRLVNSMSTLAIEHGLAIRLLASAERFASATALLRVQFEAVVRAIWLHFAAPAASIVKFELRGAKPVLEEPADAPRMHAMLDAIDLGAPPRVGRMLRDLKQDTWESGTHPGICFTSGYSPDHALDMLRNANGLTAMAAMLIALLSGDERISTGMLQIQKDHLDCLPPLAS
jgi:hypothetical protein